MKDSILILLSLSTFILSACDAEKSETWEIDNLKKIGGHGVTIYGDPEVVETEIGMAVYFDGDGDMLMVDKNPIGKAEDFTVEVVFKPTSSYPENITPRFIHIQDPDDEDEKRLMIELRINEHNQCYLDGYMHTDSMNLVLMDDQLLHPTNQWLHASITYEKGVMTTYVNGNKQLSGQIGYSDIMINPTGKVAIGGRMNQIHWFNGFIKTLKVTHAALEPGDFLDF